MDGLYHFTKSGSFKEHLNRFFEQAFLPLLEYAYHLYPQPNAYESINPSKKTFPHLTVKDHPIELEKIDTFPLKEMVEKLSTKEKGKVQGTKLTVISIEFAVPPDAEHEFWSRRNIARHDGKYVNGIPIQVEAFGRTACEARENAMERFLTFLNNCRDELGPASRSCHKDFCKQQTFSFEDDIGLKMAKELMENYGEEKEGLLSGDQGSWARVSAILERYLGTLPEDHQLIPLINYYLVSNYFYFLISNGFQGVRSITSGALPSGY
jgi:hypothetical protein